MSLANSPNAAGRPARPGRLRRPGAQAHGEPQLWLMAAGLALSLAMIAGLLALVMVQGFSTFWPLPLVQVTKSDGKVLLGEVTRSEQWRVEEAALASLPADAKDAARARIAADGGVAGRRLLRTGNFEMTGEHFHWVSDFEVRSEEVPAAAVVVERRTWGRFYGVPVALVEGGKEAPGDAAAVLARVQALLPAVQERWQAARRLEKHDVGALNRRLEEARLAVRAADREHGRRSPEHDAAVAAEASIEEGTTAAFAELRARIQALDAENATLAVRLRTADGKDKLLPLGDIVRVVAPNALSTWGKLAVYADRWVEFVSDDPREANSEGGVFPAIFGTVAMTMLLSLLVTPLGVMAALYLREYARGGLVTSVLRVAINNLAGVPSIVFGVFGLGFFCYMVGAGLDAWLYPERLPSPTFGTGGILWSALTLALLTLPVVIVATEEALAAVPNSMREGSYACGASKWQTIRRIVLPRAMPGILTGMILAIARGAGEVAPLMLVGAVKLAPELPVDGVAPFVHLQRSFMHLGFHIYDVGFQSQNSEAAKPMVFTTTLLLIAIVASLNFLAILLRARLKRRFQASHF